VAAIVPSGTRAPATVAVPATGAPAVSPTAGVAAVTTPPARVTATAASTLAARTPAPAAPPEPDASGAIRLALPAGDVAFRLTLVPRALGVSDYAVELADADGRPYPDARRVALKLAMRAMNHGVYDAEATAQGDGRYLARSNHLVMVGAWQGWVVAELPDGSIRSATFAFRTGPEQPAAVQSAVVSQAPPGVQLVDLVAYPDATWPAEVALAPGAPTRVEAMLMDGVRCGDRLRIPSQGLEAPFAPSGFAHLDLQVDAPRALVPRCTSQGLILEPGAAP
jgi:hypothetical protein